MAAVSETIVREYFELHSFLVRQHRKYVASNRKQERRHRFLRVQSSSKRRQKTCRSCSRLPTSQWSRAIVVVKGWHTETFSSARLVNSPEIFRFVEPKVFTQAARHSAPMACH